ncbi:unnamed protein product [Mytilus edulis]|uniref:Tyr recombinase domain-containing protein n=1 Tax=Mytilus edulis TaxID=6550 RepID=A0A8S3S6Z1_MYTED|nr:unnamed protein product [Mytilus edulis]
MSSILSRNISSTCTSTSTLTAQQTSPNEQQTGPVSSCNKPCWPYTATNENETAVLPIQDKTIFNVQNNGQNVADNMDSSNTNTCNFQQKMKNSSQMNYNQLFPAGTIIQGGTFNMYFGHNPQVAQPDKENDPSYSKPLKRKRKFVIESDSLGNHPNAAEALESEDEEELYRSGGFGTDDPDSLLSTIWYMNTIHFGLRGSHEHRQLKWGDLKLETDRNENQCLSYNERLTKTRDGSNTKNTRAYAPKSWSNPQDERKCHISTYLKYRSNRPTETCQPDSPFYLGVNRSDNAKHWYKNQPLGEKSLKNLMKQAVAKSNVEKNKKLTNHSGRKTAITRLLDEGVPITLVQQHTGHKSVQSLNNYAKNSLKTQKKMSSILCRNISSTCTSTNTNECTVSTLTAQPTCPNEQQTAPVSSCNKPCRPYTATNENETAVLPIQDKTIFNVQNNGQNVADNMDSSNTNTCNNNFQQKMKNSSQMNYNQLFPAGTIIQGGTFNMYFGHNPQVAQPDKENDPSYSKPLKRKRKFVIESDSDDE